MTPPNRESNEVVEINETPRKRPVDEGEKPPKRRKRKLSEEWTAGVTRMFSAKTHYSSSEEKRLKKEEGADAKTRERHERPDILQEGYSPGKTRRCKGQAGEGTIVEGRNRSSRESSKTFVSGKQRRDGQIYGVQRK